MKLGLTMVGGASAPPRRRTRREKLEAIVRKKIQIRDALAWIEDLKELERDGHEITREEKFAAANYIVMLQDDLKRLQQEQTDD